jgi:hypothetical protein
LPNVGAARPIALQDADGRDRPSRFATRLAKPRGTTPQRRGKGSYRGHTSVWRVAVGLRNALLVVISAPSPDTSVVSRIFRTFIYWARLRRVYYANTRVEAAQIGFDDGFIYGEVAQAPELRRIPHLRLITDDAQVAFMEWAASPEKIRY